MKDERILGHYPYMNIMNGFEDAVWNYDNTILFEVRYAYRNRKQKHWYRNHSLLYNYCKRVTATEAKACRLFIALGRLGILDIVDLLEAKDYLLNVDPWKHPNTKLPHTRMPYLFNPTYRMLMLKILNMVERGIDV